MLCIRASNSSRILQVKLSKFPNLCSFQVTAIFHLKINDFGGFTFVFLWHLQSIFCLLAAVFMMWYRRALNYMVEFVIGALWDLLSICDYWLKKYHGSPGLAVSVISAFLFWKICMTVFHEIFFTLDLIILSALLMRILFFSLYHWTLEW